MKLTKRYIKIPVSLSAPLKRLIFKMDGEIFFDLEAKYCEDGEFTAYAESPIKDKEIDITIDGRPVILEESDAVELDGLYKEKGRPAVHFTVANGWNNDPNGMIKYGDLYHMFYQYNPCAPEWGNMHWGHAVSTDMLTWKELPVALMPDRLGTMFSGSAIEDKDGNMLLFYTAAGSTSLLSSGAKFSQCRALSNDGFTFEKYEGNPVIPHIEAENRDPKVVYSKTLEKYLLAIFLNDNRYALFTSDDLTSFEKLDEITLDGDAECPDILVFDYEGKEKYVLMGASDKYVVGSLDTGRFIKETETLTLCPSSVSYAGQSISGLDGRVVRISWHRLPVKGGRFSQQMSIPYELTLEKGENGFYLKSAPISELLSLRLAPIAEGCAFTGTKAYELSDAAYDIELDCVGGTVSLSVFGNTLEFSSHGKARIIVDRKSIELWYNDYECYEVHYIEYESSSLSITAEDGVNSLSIYPLKDIHE